MSIIFSNITTNQYNFFLKIIVKRWDLSVISITATLRFLHHLSWLILNIVTPISYVFSKREDHF